MPALSFSSPQQLFKAAKSMKVGACVDTRPLLRDGGIYNVGGRPMKLTVVRRADNSPTVQLTRIPVETASLLERFVAVVFRLLGRQPSHTVNATPKAARVIAALMDNLEAQETSDLLRFRQERNTAASTFNRVRNAGGIHSPEGVRQLHASAIEALENRIVSQFQHCLRDVMPALKELYIEQPIRIAQEAKGAMLEPILAQLGTELAVCEPLGLNAASRQRILERLGISSQVGYWQSIAATVADPAERRTRIDAANRAEKRSAGALVEMHFDLFSKAVPVAQPGLPQNAEIAFGDMHGNAQMMLHVLVKLGFMRIKNELAWKAAIKSLALTCDTETNHNYRDFRALLAIALEPNPDAGSRKLVLLGDLLADRVHHDMFMLSIFDCMDAAGVRFDILFSNHDASFISYYLHNKDKPDSEAYTRPSAEIGASIPTQQSISLHRLHELMVRDRKARSDLRRWTEGVYFKHLKLLSCSENQANFYSHAFVNAATVDALCAVAAVDPSLPLNTRIEQIEVWFHQAVLTDTTLYRGLTEPAAWHQPIYALLPHHAPVPPLWVAAWNIGQDAEAFIGDVAHPQTAGLDLPGMSVAHSVHGHTANVGVRLRRCFAEWVALQERLPALSNAALTGEYMGLLNAFLRDLATGVLGQKVAVNIAVSCIQFVLNSLNAADPEMQTGVGTLIDAIMATDVDNSAISQALTQFWNTNPACVGDNHVPVPPFTDVIVNALRAYARASGKMPPSLSTPDSSILFALSGLAANITDFDNAVSRNLSAEELAILEHMKDPVAARREAYLGKLDKYYASLDSHEGMHLSRAPFTREAHIA